MKRKLFIQRTDSFERNFMMIKFKIIIPEFVLVELNVTAVGKYK